MSCSGGWPDCARRGVRPGQGCGISRSHCCGVFGQFAVSGSSATSYQQAEEPVSQLINDFGPPVANVAAARQRATMPFGHLERDLVDSPAAVSGAIAEFVPTPVP